MLLPLLIVFGLATAGAAALFIVGGAVEETAPPPVPALPTVAAPDTAAVPEQPGTVKPVGLEPGSLMRRGELDGAIKALRAKELGAFVSLRVSPERVDAQLKDEEGRLSIVQVTPGPSVNVLSTTGPSFGFVPELDQNAIDPRAPEKLLRAAAERSRKKTNQVDYVVLMRMTQPTWNLFFKGGTHFRGDAAGKLIG